MKYIILSLNTGGGHNTAANAVAQSLRNRGAQVEVYDCLSIISPYRSKLVCGAYLSLVRHWPRLFGWVYKLSFRASSAKHKSVVYAVNAQNVGRLADFINARKPDGVISTHIFSAQQLTYLRRHEKLNCWLGGVVTDYDVQPFWNETELDMVFTPNEEFKAGYAAVGLPEKTLAATGIPVDPSISERADIAEAKRAMGLDPARRHVLVAGGSMGAGKLPGTIDALMDGLDSDVLMTVVCGNNRALIRRFNKLRVPDTRLRVMGFVRPLHAFMRAADVIITKPGGLSSTEAFVQRIPVVVAHPIQGVESNNAAFMERNGLALCPETDAGIVSAVNRLLNNPELARDMLSAQRDRVPLGASARIAERILKETRLDG